MNDVPDGPLVDPRAPRFGQAVTTLLLVAGLATGEAVPVFVVAGILLAAVLSGWRLQVYGLAWRALQPLVGHTPDPEPAAPHRFATLVGATGTATASALLLAGWPGAGFAVAAAVAAAAGLAATTGICLGCRLYRQVGVARRLGVV